MGSPTYDDGRFFGDILLAMLGYGQEKMQSHQLHARAGFVAGTAIAYYSNSVPISSFGGGGLFSVQNDSTNGNAFTIIEDCEFSMEMSVIHGGTGEDFGISVDSPSSNFVIGGFNTLPETQKIAPGRSRQDDIDTVSMTIHAKAGQVYRAHNNNNINLGTSSRWQVRATARSLKPDIQTFLQSLGVI